MITAVNGPDTAIMKVTQERGTLEASVKWLQWITEPENNSFLINESEAGVPTSPEGTLGPLWKELATFKKEKYTYVISWWGEVLYQDAALYNEVRKLFVAWMTGQLTDEEFFERQYLETMAACDRYDAALKEMEESEE